MQMLVLRLRWNRRGLSLESKLSALDCGGVGVGALLALFSEPSRILSFLRVECEGAIAAADALKAAHAQVAQKREECRLSVEEGEER